MDRKIHPEMLNIIRTEYAKELRENTSLFTLVPRIALSVDAMLAKYDKIPSVSKVSGEVRGHIWTEDKVQVMKIKQGRRNVDKGRSTDSKRFCAGCFYLGNKVSAKINFKHHPADCPRGSAMVALLEAEEEHDDPGKILKVNASPMPKNAEQVPAIQTKISSCKKGQLESFAVNSDERILLETNVIESCIFRLNAVMQKASSPALNIKLNNASGIAVVDEGSELNCIDECFVRSSGCETINTKVGAKGAGNSDISIGGQTRHPVIIKIRGENYLASIDLGICLVVKNLGANVLIGQPAKENHEIVTIPHLKEICFKDMNGIKRRCCMLKRGRKVEDQVTAEVMRVEEDIIVYPGDSFNYKPD